MLEDEMAKHDMVEDEVAWYHDSVGNQPGTGIFAVDMVGLDF